MNNREQRTLLILRHGKAVKGVPVPDRDRPLAPEGKEHLNRMRQYAVNKALVPKMVLSSDALRARETAEHFCRDFTPPPPLLLMRELYDAGGDDVLAIVRTQADHIDCLLVVGHNPAFAGLVAQLSAGTGMTEPDFPPGALAIVKICGRWADLDDATVAAIDIVRPSSLSDIALSRYTG